MSDFSGSVVNQQSSDSWKTLSCPGTERLTITVAPPAGAATGGILYELGRGIPMPVFEHAEQPLLPATHHRERRCDAVRFRSLVAGKPAVVSIETATAGQMGGSSG